MGRKIKFAAKKFAAKPEKNVPEGTEFVPLPAPPPEPEPEKPSKSEERLAEKVSEIKAAVNTLAATDLIETRRKLYGEDGPPASATHVIRCGACKAFMLFHAGVPFNEKGLGDKACKSCGKKLNFADRARREFHPESVFTIDQDIQNHLNK